MKQNLDMDDWCMQHANSAAQEGWCLSEVGLSTTPHSVEIQRIDDADTTSVNWGIQIPQLVDDDQAVQVLHAAWQQGEPHAELAYQILRSCSPSEFQFWGMNAWTKNG
jgi:hypothetical protein